MGAGVFIFCIPLSPLLVKSGLVKTTFENIPIFAKRLLRGIRVNSSHFLFLFLKLFIACGFGNKNKICVPLCQFEKWF